MAAEFTDVPANHWAYSAIQTAAEKGITSGYSDGTFKPSAPVTNIQFVVMLSRAFYGEDVAQWAADAAASKNDWWWPNWYALTSRHLLTGDELFENQTSLEERGNLGITRQDMAWLLADVLSEKGGSATEEQKAGAQAQIAGYASIPAEYQESMKTAFALGLITGYSGGTFGGGKTMNRAQGCIVIDRLAQYVGDGSATGPAVSADDDPTEVPNSPGSTPAGQDANGETAHVLTAASSVNNTKTAGGVTCYYVDTYEGNMNSSVVYTSNGTKYITDDLYRGSYYEAWTRYPD